MSAEAVRIERELSVHLRRVQCDFGTSSHLTYYHPSLGKEPYQIQVCPFSILPKKPQFDRNVLIVDSLDSLSVVKAV